MHWIPVHTHEFSLLFLYHASLSQHIILHSQSTHNKNPLTTTNPLRILKYLSGYPLTLPPCSHSLKTSHSLSFSSDTPQKPSRYSRKSSKKIPHENLFFFIVNPLFSQDLTLLTRLSSQPHNTSPLRLFINHKTSSTFQSPSSSSSFRYHKPNNHNRPPSNCLYRRNITETHRESLHHNHLRPNTFIIIAAPLPSTTMNALHTRCQ